jgi:hypothetical protein
MKSVLLCFFLIGCTCSRDAEKLSVVKSVIFDDKITQQMLEMFTERSHPFGSQNQRDVASKLISTLESFNVVVEERPFSAPTPNPEIVKGASSQEGSNATVVKDGKNILAISKEDLDKPCLVAIASHYDTKNIEGAEYLGANDSGSSSAGLVTILASLATQKWNSHPCGIIGIWFDGEESVLPGWTDGEKSHPAGIKDNTYGSRQLASELSPCAPDFCLKVKGQLKALKAFILMDMIGSPNLSLSLDSTAHPELEKKLMGAAEYHQLSHVIGSKKDLFEDDHIPFAKLGIPAINLIDFNNIEHWHRPSDTLSTVSLNSIKNAIILASSVAYLSSAQP